MVAGGLAKVVSEDTTLDNVHRELKLYRRDCYGVLVFARELASFVFQECAPNLLPAGELIMGAMSRGALCLGDFTCNC